MNSSEMKMLKQVVDQAVELIQSHTNQEVLEFSVTWVSQYNPTDPSIMHPNVTLKLTPSKYS